MVRTILLSNDYEGKTDIELEQFIKLGIKHDNNLNKELKIKNNDSIVNEYEEKIKKINDLNEKVTTNLKNDIKRLNISTLECSEGYKLKVKNQYKSEVDDLELTINKLKTETGLFYTKKRNDENDIRKEYDAKYNKLLEKILVKKSTVSVGKEGESEILKILHYNFSTSYEITDCSKVPNKGDFSIINDKDNLCGMIEVKNWDNSVDKLNINKFVSNINDNNEYSYGIICSLKSRFRTIDNIFHLDFIKGKPIIFISNFNDYKTTNYNILITANSICRKLVEYKVDSYSYEKQEKLKTVVKKLSLNINKDKSLLKDYFENTMKRIDDNINNISSLIELI